MTKVAITKDLLDDLADAIAAKSGESTPMTLTEMTEAVEDIALPSGSINISTNGSHDVTDYETAVVAVSAPAPSLQTKTNISPMESSQTITADTGYDGLDSVQINAISSSYVGSGVTRRSSSDLTASGATITAPAGYYASAASKSVSSGSATAPASISGTSAAVSTGTNTLTLSKSVSVTPSVTAGYVSSGTAGNSSVSLTASVTTKAAASYTPSTQTQTIAANQYLTGAQTINPIPSQYIIPSGNKEITANGNNIDVANYSTVSVNVSGGGGKNVQYVMDRASVRTSGYASTGMSLTVAKTGTYNVSWVGWRSSSQGTMGSNLYVNSHAGTNQTTFTNTYGQQIVLTNQSYNAGDVLTLYATAGSTTRYMNVANLIIEEQ